jgi:hypothetical protein
MSPDRARVRPETHALSLAVGVVRHPTLSAQAKEQRASAPITGREERGVPDTPGIDFIRTHPDRRNEPGATLFEEVDRRDRAVQQSRDTTRQRPTSPT